MGIDKWHVTKEELREALKKAEWKIDKAAEIFGVPRSTLGYRLKREGLTEEIKENRKLFQQKIDLQRS